MPILPALDCEAAGPLMLSILKGDTSAQRVARKHGLTVAEVEEWQERFLLRAENALRAQGRRRLKDEQIKEVQAVLCVVSDRTL